MFDKNDELMARLRSAGNSGQTKTHSGQPQNQGQKQHQGQPKTRQEDQQYKRQDDRGDAKRHRGWTALLRIASFCAAIYGMYISAQFSVDGFSISVPDREWVGWGLAIILIVIQSAWQRFGDNLTIFVLAMVCYIYGISTNVIGIIGNRGGVDNVIDLAIPLVFGLLLEVFPEPFLAWSISGDISSDPVKKFGDRWS